MKFSNLGLSEATMAGINDAGFTDCTPVQELVLPHSLSNRDVMVQSKTGSGKTAIYVITILEKYMRAKLSNTALPVALVVAPTRELAVQIEEDAQKLAKHVPDFRVGCFYGGVGYGAQERELEEGLSLYVGTPGRLIDFAKSHKLDMRMFTTVVLDEADRMFDMGFYPDITWMFSRMLPPKDRQTMLLSATLSTKVRNLAWDYMNDPVELESQPEEITVKKIKQELFHVTHDEEFGLLLSILKKHNPRSTLIFTNMKGRAVEVSDRLALNGYRSAYLMGDMRQTDRLKTLDKLKEGKLDILVATDVAARGLQIDDLELVVNYDLPEDVESYVHRIGRTARAGKEGRAITLASEDYIYSLESIENYIQMKIPVVWADEYGLEPVEDKSEGYRRPRTESRGSRGSRSGSGRGGRSSSSSRGSSSRSSSSSRNGGQRRDGGRPSSKGGDSQKRSDSQRNRKPRQDNAPKKTGKQYSEMASMSLDERMKRYKDEYGSASQQPKKNQQQTQGKPQEQRKAQDNKPRQAKPKAPVAAVSSAPVHPSAQPEKKKSVWDKVVSIFRGGK